MKVVIADDQALVRGGFRLILKSAGIEVAAEAADGATAVAAAARHRPDGSATTETAADPARAAAQPHDVASVPALPGPIQEYEQAA